jgi:nucleoside 2-deoxyribosyltransferase
MKYVYLSGPMSGLTVDEANDWRQQVSKKLQESGIRGINPMRGVKSSGPMTNFGDGSFGLHGNMGIVSRDRFDVINSSVVLVNLLNSKKVSIGTVMEVGWADAHRIPIVVAMEPNNIHDHVMIRGIATYIAPTLEQAIDLTVLMLENFC